MKKILIVGSKGFIGSYVSRHFSATDNYEVWGCDVVNDYGLQNYFVIDAGNSDYEELFQTMSFSICINCSGSASVPDSLVHPLRDFYLNTVNMFKLVEAIRKYTPTCKFLNISSAAVYGNPAALPVLETAPLKPLSPYGYHKMQAEQICREYYELYNIETCSIRVFSAYGDGLRKQLFWDIAQKIKGSRSITLFGTGQESRDFIHITDIIQAIDLVICKVKFEGACINVANGAEVSIKAAAAKLLNALEWKGELYFSGEGRAGDPGRWKADIANLINLGYCQKTTFDDGINQYAKWLSEEKE